MNSDQVSAQQSAFDELYNSETKYAFHTTTDKLIRFLRDRRLYKAFQEIKKKYPLTYKQFNVLITCGGVGGEGIFFMSAGFRNVTVTDISENSLIIAQKLSKELKISLANAEALEFHDSSFDIVVVQDGLHHLPRPVLGFTEMLRVARKVVVVIEPQKSLIGDAIGTKWEVHGSAVNYVFRWTKNICHQVVKSYLLKNYSAIRYMRYWDHNLTVLRLSRKFPKRMQLIVSRTVYALLTPFNFFGNMMTAIIFK